MTKGKTFIFGKSLQKRMQPTILWFIHLHHDPEAIPSVTGQEQLRVHHDIVPTEDPRIEVTGQDHYVFSRIGEERLHNSNRLR